MASSSSRPTAFVLLTYMVAILAVNTCGYEATKAAGVNHLLKFPPLPAIEDELMEVYNGDHFADLTFDKNEEFRLATLLVLYEPSCKEHAQALGMFDTQALPPVTYLNYMTHDYIAWKEKAWFQLLERQDLAALYDVTSCPTALFWEKGSAGNALPVRWTRKQPVPYQTWVRSQMIRSIHLLNSLSEDVEFLLLDDGEPKHVVVQPQAQITMRVHQPWKGPVIARKAQSLDFLNLQPIVSNDQQLHIVVPEGSPASRHWTHLIEEQRLFWEDAKFFREDSRARNLLIMEQPPKIQNFTEHGFTLQRLPPTLHDHLWSLYKSNTQDMQKQAMRENHAKCASVLNDEEVDMYRVEVPASQSEFVISRIRVLAEKWCKCRLRNSRGVRFRRYHKGSRVRMHLDVNNSTTGNRMVGAVFQVGQDLRGAPDWEFAVIGPDGLWHRLNNTPGDLILFEPSLIPHGRPQPLKGETFLNGFVHYDADFDSAGKDEL